MHWDDWMQQQNRLYPALANDDSHALESARRDTYQGWTWVRVKERTGAAISDSTGTEYHQHGELFETATFPLRANSRWVRFEIVDQRGLKAWSNPFDLTGLARA